MDCTLPGSSVHRIVQAKILEWVAISFSGDLPDSGIEPITLMSPALAVGFFTSSSIFYYIKQCKKSQAQASLNGSISPCTEREGQGTECLRASSSIFFLVPRELKQHSRNHCPGRCLLINFCFSKNFVKLMRVGFISRNACIYCYCLWCKELTYWKRPWCWERLRAWEEVGDRGWDGWMASPTQWTWVWATLGESEGQRSLGCCSLWGCKESDTT